MNDAITRPGDGFVVFVVDDDSVVRDALGLLLRVRGYEAALFGCAEDFLSILTPEVRGCLVTDIRMPGMNGLALQQALTARRSRLQVVVLTGHGDVNSARKILRSHESSTLACVRSKSTRRVAWRS